MGLILKSTAKRLFEMEVLPGLNHKDDVAIRTAWHMFTDDLHRNGQITLHQYENWVTPKNFKERKSYDGCR